MSDLIRRFLDIFYPIVSRIFDKTTYYYAVVGVSNLLLSWVLFYVLYHFVLHKANEELTFIKATLSPYTATAFVCAIFSFVYGFTLLKFIVFTDSQLQGKTQLFRYGISALISSISSWLLLKLMIEWLQFFPSIANVIASCIVVVISYILQRKFTFK